jgi:acetyl-CoA acetyltransferase
MEMPLFHAQMMQRHMHLYGTTPEQLGEIAVTFRRHAGLTPAAALFGISALVFCLVTEDVPERPPSIKERVRSSV